MKAFRKPTCGIVGAAGGGARAGRRAKRGRREGGGGGEEGNCCAQYAGRCRADGLLWLYFRRESQRATRQSHLWWPEGSHGGDPHDPVPKPDAGRPAILAWRYPEIDPPRFAVGAGMSRATRFSGGCSGGGQRASCGSADARGSLADGEEVDELLPSSPPCARRGPSPPLASDGGRRSGPRLQ